MQIHNVMRCWKRKRDDVQDQRPQLVSNYHGERFVIKVDDTGHLVIEHWTRVQGDMNERLYKSQSVYMPFSVAEDLLPKAVEWTRRA